MALTASRPAVRRVRPVTQHDSYAVARRALLGVLLVSAIGSIVILLLGGALLAYGASHNDRAFAGVSLAGMDVGGMSESEIREASQERFNSFLAAPIEFQTSEGTFTLTPAELGIRYDTTEMAERAYAFGRTGTLWTDSRYWLNGLSGGYDVPLAYSFDTRAFQQTLTEQVAPLVRAPRDATFVQLDNGEIIIDPGQSGLAFDLNLARAAAVERAASMSTEPIEITAVEMAPTITDATLQQALAAADNLAGGPLTLTLEDRSWVIDQAALFAMLNFEISHDQASVSIDRSALLKNVRSIARSVYQPATDASIANREGEFVVEPVVMGHRLDAVASVDAILASLAGGVRDVDLVTDPVGPHVSDADVAAALAEAEELSANPISVTWDSGSQTIDAQELAEAIRFTITPDRSPRVWVSFDPEAMRRALALVDYRIETKPVDADLRWVAGAVEVRTPEQLGRELDIDATLVSIERALADGSPEVAAITRDVMPAATAAAAASIQIREQLSSAYTYYGNSVSNRLHNVELATSRANGALIPPGGIFSFNRAVGEVSTNSGYRTGYGIVGTSNGSISTIPSVGGGICQVATTVFQAAFHAGMPIVERNWHLYWIPRYGQPPSGMKGLDATVDPDYGLDMQFKNATNDWLAVVSYHDGANIHFELWGTNPGWEVVVDQPVITNVVPASQEMVYEENDQLPAGQTVFVEHAEDGFDAAIHRVVRKDGQVIDEATFVSVYAPARNVTLVGTG